MELEQTDFACVLSDTSPDGIVAVDGALLCLVWNRRMEEISRMPRREVLGQNLLDVFSGHAEILELRSYQAALAGQVVSGGAKPFANRTTGELNYLEASYSPLRARSGDITGVLVIVRDLTETLTSQEQLRQSQATVSMAQKVAQVGSWTWDLARNETDWSEQFYGILGIDPLEVAPSLVRYLETVHPGDRELEQRARQEALDDPGTDCEVEHRIIRADGEERILLSRGKVIRVDNDGKPTLWLGTSQDITERRRAEAEVRRLNQELEQRVQQRTRALNATNRELESFVYTISHDLRAPLRSINGFAEMLGRDHADTLGEEGADLVERIIASSRQMHEMTEDLLRYSHLGRKGLRNERVSLLEVIETVVDQLSFEIERFGANVVVSAKNPTVVSDWTLVHQVLLNLVGNAVTYRRPERPNKVEIEAREVENGVVISVRDDGIGIPTSSRKVIFGLFKRLHQAGEYPGTGIGLSIVQKAIDTLGGTLELTSRPGEGTEFVAMIPHQVPGATA